MSLEGILIPCSFKLDYQEKNNVFQYEALFLGLQATKNMNIGSLNVFGDSELVITMIKN